MTKLEIAEQYSWHIIEALMHRIKNLEENVEECKESIKEPDIPKILKRNMEGLIEHCEYLIMSNKEALTALRAAGF
jgi:hypothetical protein